jgi:hypothetical protein
MLHPLLIDCVNKIQSEIIAKHNIPIKLFETGRDYERHNSLIKKCKTKDLISMHLFNLENTPPLYATAVDYVFYDGRWSWNLRDSTILSWYSLFGNLALDICPNLIWKGEDRKSLNYCHFELKQEVIHTYLESIPCVIA